MNTFAAILAPLYGPAAPGVAQRVSDLAGRLRPRSRAPLGRDRTLGLSQADALLIAYPDQVTAAGATPLRALAEFCARHLEGVVSSVHLLPFYPWSSDDGFAVKDLLAVDPAYGTWADIARLGADFDLMFDAVFNHLSAQGEWFQRFLADDPHYRDFFITVTGAPDLARVTRPRALPVLTEFATAAGSKRVWTTFSADQVDLNYKNPEVLLRVVEALLFYIAQGARYIRLDAVAFLWKEIGTTCLHRPAAHRVIQLLRAVLDDVAPRVLLVTETNVPHRENVSYFGDGTNEAHLVYNFALPPLVLHSFATGNAEPLTRWAQALTVPSDRVTFFNFLASHDGIGLNPVRGILSDAEVEALVARTQAHGGFISYKHLPDGSRLPYELNINFLDALSDPAAEEPPELVVRQFLAAHAILLCLQGVPGLYFHSLFGSRGDRRGAEASGIPRRINREKLGRAPLEAALADAASLRACLFAGQRELLRIRRAHAAFAPTAPQQVLGLDPRVFAVLRRAPQDGGRVLCLQNVTATAVRLTAALPGSGAGGVWVDLRTGRRLASGQHTVLELELSPYEVLWAVEASTPPGG